MEKVRTQEDKLFVEFIDLKKFGKVQRKKMWY